jgi:ABC-type transport system involved in cytochrome c biogenesis permease subunit
MADLLVWPALVAYGVAAVAYAGELHGPGRFGRLGIWGVRLGWLSQTALLVAQAVSTDGFPWGTWAGALNLSRGSSLRAISSGAASRGTG